MDQHPTVNSSPQTAGTSVAGAAVRLEGAGEGQSGYHPVNPWPMEAGGAVADIDAILKKLAERVQYITGATGAAIGLLEGTDMVCRAASGTTAPGVGVQLEVGKGLSGECIRRGEALRCDNTEMDARVDAANCRRMGVQSIIVTPLRRNNVVVGIFELFSSQPYAFQGRDVATLQRTAEVIKRELEKRPVVVDAAYVRLPDAPSLSEPHELFDGPAETRDVISEAAPKVEAPEISSVARHEESPPANVAETAPSIALVACRNCGVPMPPGRLLCSECGSLQADPEGLPIAPAEETAVSEAANGTVVEKLPLRERIHIPKYSVGVVLVALALFVAFVPIRSNQPAKAEAASSQQEEHRDSTAAAMPGASAGAAAVASVNDQNSAQQQMIANESGASAQTGTAVDAGGSQAGSPASVASTQPQQVIVPSVGANSESQPSDSSTNGQVAPQMGSQADAGGPIIGTPHANANAPVESVADQTQYAPSTPSRSHKDEPWFMARVNNAIDSFQQMFQPPPDPGPTAEQLGDPRVVVWVDLTTGLYYCPGASTYGKGEKGKFLTQKEAHAEYFTSAIRVGCK